MLLDVVHMAEPHDGEIEIEIFVVFPDLAGKPSIGVGVAFDLDPAQGGFRDHDGISPGAAGDLFLDDADLSVFFLQEKKQRLPDVPVIQAVIHGDQSATEKQYRVSDEKASPFRSVVVGNSG